MSPAQTAELKSADMFWNRLLTSLGREKNRTLHRVSGTSKRHSPPQVFGDCGFSAPATDETVDLLISGPTDAWLDDDAAIPP